LRIVAEPEFRTTLMNDWLQRLRANDRAAREELLAAVAERLERLARKMLGRFPNVQRWAETGDVLQGALLRLLRSLEKVEPADTRAFFGLAAIEIRRELLDLARHFYGPQGLGANHANQHESPAQQPIEPVDTAEEAPEDMEKWCRFHEAVEQLPVEDREIVGLIFYHGWSTTQVAELLQVTARTVRRRWQAVLIRLHGLMHDATLVLDPPVAEDDTEERHEEGRPR
jgi:RNA polymerase sigma-70 factor (ECF subfamily)